MSWFSDLFSSKKETTKTYNETTNPWAAQQPYLTGGFEGALAALRRSQGAAGQGAPTDFVAGPSQGMFDLFRQMQGYGAGGVGQGFGGGTDVAKVGADALTGALGDIRRFMPGATGDAIRSEAAAYANSPAADGMITAALRDPYRDLTENVLPTNLRGSAARGTNMSNKAQQRAAIAERGFADRSADVSANVRGDLYNKGINTALSQLQGNDATRMSALLAGMQGGMGALGAGVDARGKDISQNAGLFDLAMRGGTAETAGRQAGLDNQMQRWNFNTNVQPWAGLDKYWGIVGSNNWGKSTQGQGTQTEMSTPSPIGQIGQLAGAFGSFMPGNSFLQGMGSLFNSGYGMMNGGAGYYGGNPAWNPNLRPT
jgi:hypothetical protein